MCVVGMRQNCEVLIHVDIDRALTGQLLVSGDGAKYASSCTWHFQFNLIVLGWSEADKFHNVAQNEFAMNRMIELYS